jgi:putative oxidoreductase
MQRETRNDIALFVLRLLMGSGIAYHGYGKIFGGFMDKFTQGLSAMGLPFPVFFAWAAALSEFLGGIFIVVGLVTPVSAGLVFVTMSVAAFVAHGKDPISVKELALAYWTIALALVWMGAGKWSLDHAISKAKKNK